MTSSEDMHDGRADSLGTALGRQFHVVGEFTTLAWPPDGGSVFSEMDESCGRRISRPGRADSAPARFTARLQRFPARQ